MTTRAIIVDDAPFIREILKALLEKIGVEVVGEASNGAEAVDLANRVKPELILMDIVMPVMSGVEATKQILKTLPECRIVAISTLDQELMVMKALEAGCCDFVTKPFEPNRLKEVVSATRSQGGKT